MMNILYQKSIKALNHIAKQETKEIQEFTKYIPYKLRESNPDLIKVIGEGGENQTEVKED